MVKPPAAVRAGPLSAYPWYTIGITVFAAAVASVLLVIYIGQRTYDVRQTAVALQEARLRQNVSRAENNLAGAIQISSVTTDLLAPLRNRQEIQRDLMRILVASNPKIVSGVGVFYAPYEFDRNQPLYGFYVDRGMLARGTTYILDKKFGFNYPAAAWYRQAWQGRGRLISPTPILRTVIRSSAACALFTRMEFRPA